MKVILREDVEKIGAAGEVVNVKDGYARNFLVPRRLAYAATSGALRRIEQEMKVRAKKVEVEKADLTVLASKLSEVSVTIPMRVGEEEKLYGSVTPIMIADSLNNQGYAVDRRSIVIEEPIRTLGSHEVNVKFKHGVAAAVRVNVIAE
ncbi:MAG TPA: 50S ribosomal protein L9 [Candidatus Kapabacteria bacterium]|nr:50S ribosomal protein L9 [Candidatus Kapabacteria bacterium]